MKSFAIFIILMYFGLGTVYAQDISVNVNGLSVTFIDQRPVNIEGRILVPVRGVFEALGFAISWDEGTRSAILESSTHTLVISVGQREFFTNGVVHQLDVPAQIINDRVMIPLRFPLESIGASLNWIGYTQTVSIAHQGILFAAATLPVAQPTPPPVVQPTPAPAVQPTPTPAVQPTPTPVAQPTPPLVVQPAPPIGVGFFANFTHFQESSGRGSVIRTVNSLGNQYTNSLTSSSGVWGSGAWRDYNLNSQYSLLTGFVVRVDGGGTALSSVTFFGDGRELLTITTNAHDQPHPVSVDLNGVNILRIQTNCYRSAFTNAIIYQLEPGQTLLPNQGVGFFLNFSPFQASQGRGSVIQTVNSLGNQFANSLTSSSGIWGSGAWRDYNLNSQYSLLTGLIVRVDGGGTALCSVTFFGDGREILSITTNAHDQPRLVSLDLVGVNILRIQTNSNRSAFTNAVIY